MAKLSQKKLSRKNKKNIKKVSKKNMKNMKNKSLVKNQSGGKLPVGQHLLNISLKACDIMKPMIEKIYYNIGKDTSGEKLDGKGGITIADGIVQYLLEEILFKDLFKGIVGEESAIVIIKGENYSVEGDDGKNYEVPKELYNVIDTTRHEIEELEKELNKKLYEFNCKDKYVFIDPIDGTAEFQNKKGEQSTICIGFSDSIDNNLPFAGIVYRPITGDYAYGCKSENTRKLVSKNISNKTTTNSDEKLKLVTSNKTGSKFLDEFFTNGWTQVKSGGAGNKMLMLIEGQATAYIQDRGVSRWDTCAAQAVIEAFGGVCCKLTDFIGGKDASGNQKNGKIESYQYKKSEGKNSVNLDYTFYNDEQPSFTPYNVNEDVKIDLKITKENLDSKVENGELKVDNKNFNPYSNLCGIVAYLDSDKETVIREACQKMALLAKPSYN